MAVINETLRLFPPVRELPNINTHTLIENQVNIIPKETSEDVLLPVASYDGKIEPFAVQEGTCLFINTVGLHYNREFHHSFHMHIYGLHGKPARYWDAPETYNPSRFLGEYNRDAFIPFSAGRLITI